MSEVTMPRLSDTMSEGTVGKWLKQPGDHVEDGDIIAEIETDKATMELTAFESGTLQKILVPEGQTVPIGTPIALIGDGAAAAEAPPSSPQPAAPAQPPQAAPQPESAPAPAPPEAPSAEGERIKASPVARRLAAERGIDLRQVKGTGPGGRIIKENVEEFQSGAAAAAAALSAP